MQRVSVVSSILAFWILAPIVLKKVTADECCDRLEIIGASDMQRLRMGLYVKKPSSLPGRPLYISEHNQTFLYYKDGDWWIGDDIGEARGGLYTESTEYCPENIKQPWKKSKDSKWHNSHITVKCAGNVSCCDQVVVSGGEEMHQTEMGLYEYRGEMQSSRKLYKQKGGNMLLYFQLGSKHQQWHIHENISKFAWLYVNDAPLCPERITESWKEWNTDNTQFYFAPEVKVECVADLDLENCCEELHVSGLDSNQPELLDIYIKARQCTDGRIAYKSETGENFLFFEDKKWWIGDVMGFAHGEFSVKDEARCPNKINEVWQCLNGSEWVNTTKVKVTCAELLPCCHNLEVVGAESLYQDSMGVYEYLGQAHDHRWVYKHVGPLNKQYFLYFSKGKYLQKWSIYGGADHYQHILSIQDASFCPENMTSSWNMWIPNEMKYKQQQITVSCYNIRTSEHVKHDFKKIVPLKHKASSIIIVFGVIVGTAAVSLLLTLYLRWRRRKQKAQLAARALNSTGVIYKPRNKSERDANLVAEGSSSVNQCSPPGSIGVWDHKETDSNKNIFSDVEPLVDNEFTNVGECRQ